MSDLLDRLLLFQRVSSLPVRYGLAIANRNSCDVPSVTVRASPGAEYRELGSGDVLAADHRGYVVLPRLAAGATAMLLPENCPEPQRWQEQNGGNLRLDLEMIVRELRTRRERV